MADNDFIPVDNKPPKAVLLDELRKLHQEYTARHEPFDFRNALIALEDYEKQWTGEVQRAIGTKQTPPQFRMKWDWKEYGNPDRFEKISSTEVREVNAKTGMLVPTLTGYNVDYRVKGKGNGISVFVPLETWNQRNKK